MSSSFELILVLLPALCLLVYLFGTSISSFNRQKNGRKLPPGPRGLPIIGNLHILGNLPHRTLHELAKKYGPIMFIRLGHVPTVVVSSPQAAELVLKTHDIIFATRPNVEIGNRISYGTKGLVFSPYGPYWRTVRKFCITELLSANKIDKFAAMRKEELGYFLESLKKAAMMQEVVNVSDNVAGLMVDMIYRMLIGMKKHDERFDLKTVIHEITEMLGAFNLADFLPIVGLLDLQGLARRSKATHKAFDTIIESIIQEHEQKISSNFQEHDQDFVGIMLSLNKSTDTHNELAHATDRVNIKAILLDMIVGSVDTSQTVILWTLSELIKNPRVMKKLQEEIKTVVGLDQMVEEKHLFKLEYLDMVIKESFRLHPIVPFLLHESMEDIEINGYYIPKKSRVIVSFWALGRDPLIWSNNVDEFLPERFIGNNIDIRGRDFQLMPFGSGRRMCPGMHLGLINVRLVLAQLVHCFNWDLPSGMLPSDLDMSERYGLTMPRAKPLLAMPTYRLHGPNL